MRATRFSDYYDATMSLRTVARITAAAAGLVIIRIRVYRKTLSAEKDPNCHFKKTLINNKKMATYCKRKIIVFQERNVNGIFT